MTRLEKKCLIASASAHGTLALLLMLGPLIWVSKRQNMVLPPLTLIPTRIIDGLIASGGNPKATAPPAPPAPAPTRPATAPPVVSPPKAETAPPKAEVKPIRVESEAPPKPSSRKVRDAFPDKTRVDDVEDSVSTKAKGHKIQVSFEREAGTSRKSSSSTSSTSDSRANAESAARAAQVFASKLNGVLGAISAGVTGGTAIEVPGPGGEVYADYGQYLILAYKRAWVPPDDLADELATVDVRIVVSRDGRIISFRPVKRSGISALDRSVERLQAAVTRVEAFPEGATDPQRTFLIHFNLKSYRE